MKQLSIKALFKSVAHIAGWTIVGVITVTLWFNIIIGLIWDDSKSLGGWYRYDRENYGVFKKIYIDGGPVVLEGYMTKYGYDRKNIILLTRDLKTCDTVYWIVTKSSGDTISFRDSLQFAAELADRGIDLEFKELSRYVNPYNRYEK